MKVNKLLQAAVDYGASDLHVTAGVPPVLRINGELRKYGKEQLFPEDTADIARMLVPKGKWETFERQGELDFSYELPGVSRFRVNAYFQRTYISLAIRIVPSAVPSFSTLGLPTVLKSFIKKTSGLVLVTGPTGSGKSTTLASMIDLMNATMRKNIITLEDPIEFQHTHRNCIIDQREVGMDTEQFASGLRAALRQDPDVILVGELRDLETISTAITAAETGHLVLGTLHTMNAPSTINRLIDVFPPSQQSQIRIQLSSVLVGILSQRLFPKVDKKGRVSATEVLVNNAAIANLIRNEKIHQIKTVMQTSKAQGMHTLETSIVQLVDQGIISEQDAQPFLQELE